MTHAATPTPGARIVHGKSLLLAGKLALAAGLIYWLIHTGRFDLSLFAAFFSPSGLWGLGAIFVLQLTAFTFVVARWAVLVRAQSIPLPFAEVLRTGYQGLASSLILPGSLGLDGIRFLHIRNRYREHMVAGAASILMDRLTGFVGLLVLGIGASALYWASSGNPQLNTLLALNVVLLLAALFLISFVCIVLPRSNLTWIRRMPSPTAMLDALELYTRHKTALLVSIALSAAGHLFTCAAWLFAMRLIGVDSGIPGVIAVTSLLTVVRTIPLTPLGLGVTDSLAEGMYSLIGISAGAELQMLVRLVSIAVFLACGVAFLGRSETLRSVPLGRTESGRVLQD